MREQFYWMAMIVVSIIAMIPIILAIFGVSPQVTNILLKIAALPTTVTNLIKNSMSALKYVAGY